MIAVPHMKKIFFACLCLLFACSAPPAPSSRTVLVSLPPYADFVEKVAQGKVDVVVLVPPGANPHIYEPSPRQVQEISKAGIWFRNGDPAENKILTVLTQENRALVVRNLTEGVSLLSNTGHSCEDPHHHHHEESKDLHVWLNPKIAEAQVAVIAETLSRAYPEFREEFKRNSENFLELLRRTDQEISADLAPFKDDAILVSHPAFGYFCAAYGLKQLSIECEGKDPLPQDIAHTLEEAEQAHVRAVFIQAQYNNKGALLIAEKLHIPAHDVDPYARDYLDNIRHLANLITHAD